MARTIEGGFSADIPSKKSWEVKGVTVAITLGVAFALWATNDNTPSGPEGDDEFLELLRRMFDPPVSPG